MSLQAEKLKLVQAVLNIDDLGLIKEVETLLKKRDQDWFDDLSEDQQQSIIRGIAQADKGETITHKEAIARAWKISVETSPYDPDFVAMVKKAEKRGNFTEIDPNNVWGSLKLK